MSRFSNLVASAVLAGSLCAGSALADTPPLFPIQGVLTDAAGDVIDGPTSIRFALYPTSAGGTEIWDELRTLDVEAGLFNAYLGEVETLDPLLFKDNGDLWLGITVEADPEMPLVRLGSSSYAAVAQHALEVPDEVVLGPQSCSPGDVVAGVDALGFVVCVPDADSDTLYTGADFALSDQLCLPGEIVEGVDANGQVVCVLDANSTYSGTDFAVSDQSCTVGSVVTGIDANGDLTCAPDANNTYSGTDFAVSGQSCTPGTVVLGVDATGNVVCVADANTTYTGVDFALSGQVCSGTDLAIGFDAMGNLQCTPAPAGGTDTLAALACGAGEMVRMDPSTGMWACIDHAGNPSAHHDHLSNNLAITPGSVTIAGTSTALTNGSIDLGSGTDDELTAAMVTTLTGGGSADALHTHAAQAAGSTPTMLSNQSSSFMNFGNAARYCRDLNESGFTDWRVGSHDEVWHIYSTTVVSNDTSTSYIWTTSLDSDFGDHVAIRFSDGDNGMYGVTNSGRARCVR